MLFQVSNRVSVALAVFLMTAPAVPAEPVHEGYVQYREWQSYDWPDPGVASPRSVSRIAHEAGWARYSGDTTVAVDYDYQPLRIRSGSPAHNGHLHRLTTGVIHNKAGFRVQGRVGLQGTSNIFKYQDFTDETLNARLAVFRAVGEDDGPMIGVGGDHRFGSFRWLPRLYWAGQSGFGRWQLDLPVQAQWQSPGRRWTLRAERAGDRWGALDRGRERESRIYLREWRLEGQYRIPLHRPFPDPVLLAGVSLDTRVEYLDEQQGTVDRSFGDAIFAGIRLSW